MYSTMVGNWYLEGRHNSIVVENTTEPVAEATFDQMFPEDTVEFLFLVGVEDMVSDVQHVQPVGVN